MVQNSTVPVIQTGSGVCHIYVDKAADIDMAANIIFNAKTSRPSVCNAAECMLIHRDIAQKPFPPSRQGSGRKTPKSGVTERSWRF